MPQTVTFAIAALLLLGGAGLVGAGLRGRRSAGSFEEALAAVLTRPIPRDTDPAPAVPGSRGQLQVGQIAGLLADPGTWATLSAALATITFRPYAVLLAPATVTLLFTGRPGAPPAPWRESEPGSWTVYKAVLPTPARSRPGAEGFVLIGALSETAVLFDLDQVPGILQLTGHRPAALAQARGILAQLRSVRANQVLVAGGLLTDDPSAPALADLLTTDPATGPLTVLACVDPTEPEATRLRAWLTEDDRRRAVVVGDLLGSRWSVRLSADGILTAEGLRLTGTAWAPTLPVPPRPVAQPAGTAGADGR